MSNQVYQYIEEIRSLPYDQQVERVYRDFPEIATIHVTTDARLAEQKAVTDLSAELAWADSTIEMLERGISKLEAELGTERAAHDSLITEYDDLLRATERREFRMGLALIGTSAVAVTAIALAFLF